VGGMRVNTRLMQGVAIDSEARIARVEAGATWGAVVKAAHQHGPAPLNGSAPLAGKSCAAAF